MRGLVLVAVAAAGVLAGSLGAGILGGGGVARSEDGAPNLADPETIAAGHKLFLAKQCAHCHGPEGKGGINLARRELDPKGVFQSITEGREKSGLRMPAWRGVMSDEDIWKVTAYILSISQHPK
jgi:mono/diheme cytochrome c family protein